MNTGVVGVCALLFLAFGTREYPPQFTVGFMSNTPPLYDVVPSIKRAVKMWWHGSDEAKAERVRPAVRPVVLAEQSRISYL